MQRNDLARSLYRNLATPLYCPAEEMLYCYFYNSCFLIKVRFYLANRCPRQIIVTFLFIINKKFTLLNNNNILIPNNILTHRDCGLDITLKRIIIITFNERHCCHFYVYKSYELPGSRRRRLNVNAISGQLNISADSMTSSLIYI